MIEREKKIVVARIGWMTWYAGEREDDPRPIGGGSFNRDKIGAEVTNFLPVKNGKLHGYVRAGKQTNLKRISPEVVANTSEVAGVTVIFIASDPREKEGATRQRVVGWYNNAVVQREYTENSPAYFNLRGAVREAVLLPLSAREIGVPRAKKGAPGQSNVWYAIDSKGKRRNPRWLSKVLDFISTYSGANLLTDPNADIDQAGEAMFEQAAGFQSDSRIRMAVEEHAMRYVKRLFRKKGYRVQDKHSRSPFDLHCTKGDEARLVEVKGTQTKGEKVILTRNEVDLPDNSAVPVDLYVVHSVKVTKGKKIVCSGGELRLYEDWKPQHHSLTPVAYSCEFR